MLKNSLWLLFGSSMIRRGSGRRETDKEVIACVWGGSENVSWDDDRSRANGRGGSAAHRAQNPCVLVMGWLPG